MPATIQTIDLTPRDLASGFQVNVPSLHDPTILGVVIFIIIFFAIFIGLLVWFCFVMRPRRARHHPESGASRDDSTLAPPVLPRPVSRTLERASAILHGNYAQNAAARHNRTAAALFSTIPGQEQEEIELRRVDPRARTASRDSGLWVPPRPMPTRFNTSRW